MARDHYGVLGVSPTSEDVVIRAAYRALMLRYHPDTDPSSEAEQRAQAINAAYSILSDPEKRARYDGSLAAQGLIKPDLPPPSGLAGRLVPGPASLIGLIGLGALAAAATMLALSPSTGVRPADRPPIAAEPQRRVAESENSDLVDEASIGPDGSLALPASSEVPNAMLEPSEEFVEALPVDARQARPQKALNKSKPKMTSPAAPSAGEKPAVDPAGPGTSCPVGNGWAERKICSSENLKALDRQYGLLYGQSLAKADEAKRAALMASIARFNRKRSACRSENCLTDTYIARLREVSDIMARGAQQ